MRNYQELKVWEKAHQITLGVYKLTNVFPKEEVYGLTAQIRRACVSVSSNIAEGSGRGSNSELARFLQISLGSLYEVEYQFLLAKDLKYIENNLHSEKNEKIIELKKMLHLLLKIFLKPNA